jgi:sensor domain CHASE-containing protein
MTGWQQANAGSFESQLQGRLNAAFWVLTGGLLSLLVAALVWFSIDQDQHARSDSERIAASAVQARLGFLSKTIADYSIWDDAYRHVVEENDRAWMDGNIGPFVFNSLHFERSYVIDDSGLTHFAMTGGKVLDSKAPGGTMPPEIARLAKRLGPEASSPSASLLLLDGRPVMVALCRIAPSSEGRTADPARLRTLIFVDEIDRQVLGEMERIYLLSGLRAGPPDAEAVARVTLKDKDGASIGALSWDQAMPGRAMLMSIAPIAAALALIVALAGSWLMRNVGRMVERMLDDRRKAGDAITRARLALAAAKAAQGDAAEARRQLEEVEAAYNQLEDLRQHGAARERLSA